MRRTKWVGLWGLIVSLSGVAIIVAAGTDVAASAKGQAIDAAELLAIVQELCRPELDGRLPGGEGYEQAARYAAAWFARWGLHPAGDEGFFHYLDVEYHEFLAPPRLALLGKSGEVEQEWVLGKDFVARGFSGSGKVSGEVVFCGYGLSSPEYGYDDCAGVDVRGRVVLAFKQPPPWQPQEAGWHERAMPRPKAEEAKPKTIKVNSR